MRSLEAVPASFVEGLRGLLFDLDDTLLDRGQLLPEALRALYDLAAAGFELYAVTGRPASWGSVVTHQWPIDGAVTENGAISWRREGGRVALFDPAGGEERSRRQSELGRIALELRNRHSELELTDDASGRISDVTFDIGEHRRVAPELVAEVRREARRLGAATNLSSVHLHVTLDRSDKASGALRLLRRATALDPTEILRSYAFIGDSENDAACFAAFRLTFGVRNWSGRPTLPPRFLTAGARAAGFVEVAALLLARGKQVR